MGHMADYDITKAVQYVVLILGGVVFDLLRVTLKISINDKWHRMSLVISPEVDYLIFWLFGERQSLRLILLTDVFMLL